MSPWRTYPLALLLACGCAGAPDFSSAPDADGSISETEQGHTTGQDGGAARPQPGRDAGTPTSDAGRATARVDAGSDEPSAPGAGAALDASSDASRRDATTGTGLPPRDHRDGAVKAANDASMVGPTGRDAGDLVSAKDASTPSTADASAPVRGHVSLPPRNAGFDYQLGSVYDPPSEAGVVTRDRSEDPARGRYNICYVNGFQAQPSDERFWLEQHPELVLHDARGEPVIDGDWKELLLDPSTPEKRRELASIIGGWIAECAGAGFDAVEIDNLDSYSRSGDLLSEEHAVAFMKLLSQVAHQNGLAIAQKNASELVDERIEMGTDFAVAEECNRYDECDDFRAGYGDDVLVVEYRKVDFDEGCSRYPQLSIVLRDVDLVAPNDPDYAYDGC